MNNKKTKVLLVYPTVFGKTGVPIGLSSISSVLKQHGHDVKVLDTSLCESDKDGGAAKIRSNRLMSKEVVNASIMPNVGRDLYQELSRILCEFKPDIVGISILEPNYNLSVKIANYIKRERPGVYVLAGGVFPILSPEYVINEQSFDAVCVGEGEYPMLEVCDRLASGERVADVEGICFKGSDAGKKTAPHIVRDVNKLPYPDFSGFSEELFLKPMQGKLYKMINVTTSRGCPYQCRYCAAPKLKGYYDSQSSGKYYRKHSISNVIGQIHHQVDRHSPEFVYFSSESFLAMSEYDFDSFVEGYKDIAIPFWFQTRPETITEERIRRLKEAYLNLKPTASIDRARIETRVMKVRAEAR